MRGLVIDEDFTPTTDVPVLSTREHALGDQYQGDPREVGDLCYDGYWNTPYVVLAITKHADGGTKSVTVLNLAQPNQHWAKGTQDVTTHMTAWDWRRDQVIDSNVFLVLRGWGYASYNDFIDEMRDIAVHWINPITGRNHA